MKKEHCSGCDSDMYNHGGVSGSTKECFMLKKAKLIMRKEVHVDQRPPWRQKSKKFPDCYRKSRYAYVDKNAIY